MPHGSSESHPPCFVTFQPAKVEQLASPGCNFQRWINRLIHGFSSTTKKRGEKTRHFPQVTKDSGNLACSKVTFCRQFPASFSTWQKKKNVMKAHGSFGTLIHCGENTYALVGETTPSIWIMRPYNIESLF